MKRGISPIVAVVLLIAIAVIAAVGLYFWVGSLTGKQATPNTPKMITANVICNQTGNSTILITNIGTEKISSLNTTLKTSDSNVKIVDCSPNDISSGETASCTITNFHQGNGTISIYGDNLGAISVTC